MGNNHGGVSEFEQHNWRKIEEKQSKVILFNDITRKSVQRHEAIQETDEGQVISLCKWRQNLPDCGVVDLYEYGFKQPGMCNGVAQLYVITERIHLFEQIGKFSRAEGFLILRNVASGLKVLFQKLGYFNARPNIMGINNEGQAKIWINENFALSTADRDPIPVQKQDLAIVNNLIRIIESKTYSQEKFPFEYPRNLDLTSTVKYIDKIVEQYQGLMVDRVYIDRSEYTKKYNEILQKELQKQQTSRTIAMQAQLKLRQIQLLHEHLQQQQLQLQQRQQQLMIQSMQAKQQQQMQRQQQMQQMQYMQQLQLQRQKQQRQRQIFYAQQNQLVQQNQIAQQNQLAQQIQQPQYLSDNSRGQILKGTTSTINTEVYSAPPNVIKLQPPATSNRNMNNVNPNTGYINQHSQVNGGYINQHSQVNGGYINQFSQVNGGYINPHSQVNGMINQQYQPSYMVKPQTVNPQQNPFKKSTANYNNGSGQAVPSAQPTRNIVQPQPQKRSSSRQRSQVSTDKIKKEIQMVDSMILMQEDNPSDQNNRYVQSRIIKYAI